MADLVPPAITKLIPALKHRIRYTKRRFRNPEGPYGRMKWLRSWVTGLVKHERIELDYNQAAEARSYAERLIVEAIRNGDKHKATMDLATFWLEEEQLIHKLFKVLVPRYKYYNETFTSIYAVPTHFETTVVGARDAVHRKAVLELKGNPFPPMPGNTLPHSGLLTNILLEEAKRAFYVQNVEKKANFDVPQEHKSEDLQAP